MLQNISLLVLWSGNSDCKYYRTYNTTGKATSGKTGIQRLEDKLSFVGFIGWGDLFLYCQRGV